MSRIEEMLARWDANKVLERQSKKVELPANDPRKVVNYYTHIKTKDTGLRHYQNEDALGIKLPARILAVGPSGSGKTNFVLDFIRKVGFWDKVVLLAKNLEEPLYKHLIDTYEEMEKKYDTSIITAIDELKDLPALSTFKESENSILIVDDFICESAADLKPIEEFWIRGRKNGVTMIFLTQSYYATPKKIRQNSNYIMLKKIGTIKDLTRLLSEYALGVDKDQLKRLYERAVKGGDITDSFMIDLVTNSPHERFRHGYTPIGPEDS